MSETQKRKTPKSKEYLEKTFLEELNHKIWCTKGARFSADARFKKNQGYLILVFHSYLLI